VIFVDANIFMYAAGRKCPQRAPCQRFLARLTNSPTPARAFTNTEVLQEILHRYRAIGVPDVGFALFDAVIGLGIQILPVTESDLRRARVLLAEFPALSTRDGVHLAVMENCGAKEVLSYDKGFGEIPTVTRIEP
jgi:predicted nucleic acid-binding protein